MLRRFAVTQNRSLDGVLQKLNSKNMKEGGLLQHELDQLDSDLEEDVWATTAGQNKDTNMPGAKTAKNLLKRNVKLAVRIKGICFSPDGTQFAAATTEGLIIYSNTSHVAKRADFFNPFEIDESVTLENIIAKVQNEEHLTAMVLALRLNIKEVTDTVYRCVPVASVPLIVAHMPTMLLLKLMQFLAVDIENGREIHWAMVWLESILKYQGIKFGQQSNL